MELLTTDLFRKLLVVLPWRELHIARLANRRSFNKVTEITNDDHFWHRRIVMYADLPYKGPYPMTLAVIIEFVHRQPSKQQLEIAGDLVIGVNIAEFYSYFITTCFEIDSVVTGDVVDSLLFSKHPITVPAMVDYLVEYYKNEDSPVVIHHYTTFFEVIPLLDEEAGAALCEKVWDQGGEYHIISRAAGWEGLAGLAPNNDLSNGTHMDLLHYATDPASTGIILDRSSQRTEIARLAWLEDLDSAISDETREVYKQRGLDHYPLQPLTTPDECRHACEVEYSLSPAMYPELCYNLNRDSPLVLIYFGLESDLQLDTISHFDPHSKVYLTSLLDRGYYGTLRRYPNIIPRSKSIWVGGAITLDMLKKVESEAPDLIPPILENISNLTLETEAKNIRDYFGT